MVTTAALLNVGVLLISAGVTTILGVYAFRNRREPGARPFCLLMATLTFWSAGYAVALVTFDPGWRLFVQRTLWFAIAPVPLFLFLFAVTYTGQGDFLTRRTVGLLSLPAALVIVAVWTNPLHHLFWESQSVTIVNGLAVLRPSFGPLFWGDVIYTYALTIAGAVLLLRLIYQSDYLYTDQSVLLIVGILAPFALNVIDVLALLPQPGVDYTPHAFAVTGITFGYALFRRQLFDLVPATRQLGRNAAIGQLNDGVVIVDTAQRIVYCNAAASDILDREPADTLGVEIRSLVDDSKLHFETEDALAEIEYGDRTYEVRSSPITDRRDQLIGHTLVVHDVTSRKERERKLAAQRDELATVNDLNAVLRGVNQGLVSATSHEGIERTVCERLVEATLYRTACAGDIATWTGDADRWIVAGDAGSEPAPPPLGDEALESTDDSVIHSIDPMTTDGDGTWTIVPIVYGRTVFGALGLYTEREDVSDRERSILAELGATVGHAINAVETRLQLSKESVIELELVCEDENDPLVSVSASHSCHLDVTGIVPGGDDADVAYVHVENANVAEVQARLHSVSDDPVRIIREDGEDGLLEWQVAGDAILRSLADYGVNVSTVSANEGETQFALEVVSDANMRKMIHSIKHRFPDTRIVSKSRRSRPIDFDDPGVSDLHELTDRQCEAIEAAFRAGYFNWPRDSTAEEVAETLDISSATLHGHLRKAQRSVLEDIFDIDTRYP